MLSCSNKFRWHVVVDFKDDPRQRQSRENYFAFGAFAQNLMLLLYEAGIGTCWKSPQYIFDPKIRKALGVRIMKY